MAFPLRTNEKAEKTLTAKKKPMDGVAIPRIDREGTIWLFFRGIATPSVVPLVSSLCGFSRMGT